MVDFHCVFQLIMIPNLLPIVKFRVIPKYLIFLYLFKYRWFLIACKDCCLIKCLHIFTRAHFLAKQDKVRYINERHTRECMQWRHTKNSFIQIKIFKMVGKSSSSNSIIIGWTLNQFICKLFLFEWKFFVWIFDISSVFRITLLISDTYVWRL